MLVGALVETSSPVKGVSVQESTASTCMMIFKGTTRMFGDYFLNSGLKSNFLRYKTKPDIIKENILDYRTQQI